MSSDITMSTDWPTLPTVIPTVIHQYRQHVNTVITSSSSSSPSIIAVSTPTVNHRHRSIPYLATVSRHRLAVSITSRQPSSGRSTSTTTGHNSHRQPVNRSIPSTGRQHQQQQLYRQHQQQVPSMVIITIIVIGHHCRHRHRHHVIRSLATRHCHYHVIRRPSSLVIIVIVIGHRRPSPVSWPIPSITTGRHYRHVTTVRSAGHHVTSSTYRLADRLADGVTIRSTGRHRPSSGHHCHLATSRQYRHTNTGTGTGHHVNINTVITVNITIVRSSINTIAVIGQVIILCHHQVITIATVISLSLVIHVTSTGNNRPTGWPTSTDVNINNTVNHRHRQL